MKNGDCKNCVYSDTCYQEQCYTQIKSICEDYKEKQKYYYMDLGGMFTKVFATGEKLEILPKYTKEINREKYNDFIKNNQIEVCNYD